MKPFALKMKFALALVLGGILAAGPGMGGQHDGDGDRGKGKGQGKGHDKGDRRDNDRRDDDRRGDNRRDDDRRGDNRRDDNRRHEGKRHFEERHTVVVREYYTEQFRGGRCPPGLRKKNNGCMPPGQAKKWQVGRPLPREVVYYEVPRPLVVQIGPPPRGHRYVRVGGDILMLAIGTGMVIDAIQNLSQ